MFAVLNAKFTRLDGRSPRRTPDPKGLVSVPETVLTDLKPRLEAARADTEDAREKYLASLELRNELVIAAVDAGMSQRAVAAAAGVGVSSVSRILLGTGRDDFEGL